MYIVNKTKTQIVNLEQVTAVYIGADECSIKVDFSTGKGCQIAKYDSTMAAVTALEMLGKAIGKAEAFFFPSDEYIRGKIQENSEQKQHHIAGKKTKGHGGS